MLKAALTGILAPEEVQAVYGGFDVIGDIAIIRVPENLLGKTGAIAQAILFNVRHVKTVLRQVSPVSGDFRLRELEWIGGENRSMTVARESGCDFKVDLRKVFFSPRLATERLRVAGLTGTGEVVLNLFGGVGPFSIVVAKKNPSVRVYSVEANVEAHRLAEENVRLNRVDRRVVPVLGDCRRVVEESLRGVADRVLMPLPERAGEFLDVALNGLKAAGGVVHFYVHTMAERGEDPRIKAIGLLGEKLMCRWQVLFSRAVREVGPRWFEVVVDFRVG